MNFIELLKYLEDRLGYHQFPVNRQAKDLAQIFDSSAAHHDFIVKFAHELYRANKCNNLHSPVNQGDVEKVLARLRMEILDAKKTDIDLYHFIEDLCVVIFDFFTSQNDKIKSTARKAY